MYQCSCIIIVRLYFWRLFIPIPILAGSNTSCNVRYNRRLLNGKLYNLPRCKFRVHLCYEPSRAKPRSPFGWSPFELWDQRPPGSGRQKSNTKGQQRSYLCCHSWLSFQRQAFPSTSGQLQALKFHPILTEFKDYLVMQLVFRLLCSKEIQGIQYVLS